MVAAKFYSLSRGLLTQTDIDLTQTDIDLPRTDLDWLRLT